MLVIRKAEPSDLNTVVFGAEQFFAEIKDLNGYFPAPGPALTKSVARLMDLPGFTVYLAEEDGNFVGAVGFLICPNVWDCDSLHGEEVFWWCAQDAPILTAGRLAKHMFVAWANAGVKTFHLSKIVNSPSKVDGIYRRWGAKPLQVIYAGVM